MRINCESCCAPATLDSQWTSVFAVKSLTDTDCIVVVQMETAKLSAETLFEDCSQLARREVDYT